MRILKDLSWVEEPAVSWGREADLIGTPAATPIEECQGTHSLAGKKHEVKASSGRQEPGSAPSQEDFLAMLKV